MTHAPSSDPSMTQKQAQQGTGDNSPKQSRHPRRACGQQGEAGYSGTPPPWLGLKLTPKGVHSGPDLFFLPRSPPPHSTHGPRPSGVGPVHGRRNQRDDPSLASCEEAQQKGSLHKRRPWQGVSESTRLGSPLYQSDFRKTRAAPRRAPACTHRAPAAGGAARSCSSAW